MQRHADIAVIGAGIVGLAHALEAAKRGLSVVLFERNLQAQGASIRNFGMIWPIGQAPGKVHQRALRTRDIWLELAAQSGIWCAKTGSLQLAYQPDEWEVIAEFAALAPKLGFECELIGPEEALGKSRGGRSEGLKGALWSALELCIDPRQVIAALPKFLADAYGVTLRFGMPVQSINLPQLQTPTETWMVERAVVCSGIDFVSLYPDTYKASGLIACKLQMMRTAPQPQGWRLGPHLAGGLTLRHYEAFKQCASLGALEARIKAENPQFNTWGIHVLASQNGRGEIVIGDSHEYGEQIEFFDRPEIDALILNYLKGFLTAPKMDIVQRWHGIYAKHPDMAEFIAVPADGVRVVNGIGGVGMSTGFGLAQEVFDAWD